MDLNAFLSAHADVVCVRLQALKGSSPREEGASLFVSQDAIWGTIGGGQLEYVAMDEARRMLRKGQKRNEMTIPLGPEIGQCCGGVVTLRFDVMDAASRAMELQREAREKDEQPHVYVFGSGHVGRALAASLSLLPLRVIVIDSRAEELALLPPAIERHCLSLPEAMVRQAPARSAFVILTHDHALDFLLTREALLRKDATYVGMIGSKSKRGTFLHWLRDGSSAGPQADHLLADGLTCPIGTGGSRDKRPAVIAAMVSAEIMTAFDQQAAPVSQARGVTQEG